MSSGAPADRPRATRPVRTIAVVICTYRRPDAVVLCLEALGRQTRLPSDVILVVRPDDEGTHAALSGWAPGALPTRVLAVTRPGLVAARNVGLEACRSDVVAFCDDDTVAHPEWLARIMAHFEADPALGGLGGRDRCHDGTAFDERQRHPVGRLQWFGRAIGNHHLGRGAPQEVQILKGANMTYRTEAIGPMRFDGRLRGKGAQAHDDLAFSLTLHRRGWRLLYDPAVAMDHYCSRPDQPRAYVAGRTLPDAQALADASYNYVLAIWPSLPPAGKAVSLTWFFLVGMRVCPGLMQAVRLTPSQRLVAWQKFAISQRGVLEAYRSLLPSARPPAPGRLRWR